MEKKHTRVKYKGKKMKKIIFVLAILSTIVYGEYIYVCDPDSGECKQIFVVR